MSRYAVLRKIQLLDPVEDHQQIVYLSTCFDFPFDTTRALEFALFRTFCAPRISAILDRTGEFRNHTQKRYDDTDLIISEMIENGYDNERGTQALRRMNQIHSRFEIENEDLLYVLSTFIFEPIRWNQSYGWRKMCIQERLGFFHFWRQVGLRMKIREIPEKYDNYEAFNRRYESDNFCFAAANQRTGTATRELFVSWFPQLISPLVRSAIHTMLDPPVLSAFGFPSAAWSMQKLVKGILRARARGLRLCPPRRRPRLRTTQYHSSYPAGYKIEELGPDVPEFQAEQARN